MSVVVVDNDKKCSAREVVEEAREKGCLRIEYYVEPRKGIVYARNTAVGKAAGDYLAFIDDDEFAPPSWLMAMYATLVEYNVGAVFGPVRPHFEAMPPRWVIESQACARLEHRTGFVMPWGECRTGNVLIRKSILAGLETVFRAEFNDGSEDLDLFRRLIQGGQRFVWCNEGVVYEEVPPSRCSRGYHIRRALLRGKVSLQHENGRGRKIVKAFTAIPLYGLLLPFAQVVGHGMFMKYLLKLCNHAGVVLALFGLNPVKERGQ